MFASLRSNSRVPGFCAVSAGHSTGAVGVTTKSALQVETQFLVVRSSAQVGSTLSSPSYELHPSVKIVTMTFESVANALMVFGLAAKAEVAEHKTTAVRIRFFIFTPTYLILTPLIF